MKKMIIIGASGHGKVVADIAKQNGYHDIVFLDDDVSKTECAGYPVIGRVNDASYIEGDKIVAIGDEKIREQLQKNLELCVLVHPNAVIGSGVKIGQGTVVMAGAVINADTVIGQGCIVNTSSSIDHDCIIEDYVHVSVGAHLCGTVFAGKSTWIGAGATISNNVKVCSGCVIGAGTVVINDINISGTYVGVPAKLLKRKEI